jgi:hypothetical protein
MVTWLYHLGLEVKQTIMVESAWWSQAAHIVVVGKRERGMEGRSSEAHGPSDSPPTRSYLLRFPLPPNIALAGDQAFST